MSARSTRRQLLGTTAAVGVLGLAARPAQADVPSATQNGSPAELGGAATREGPSTIVNPAGVERLESRLDALTVRNLVAAAHHERDHFELLTSKGVGAMALATTIHVPDAVFAQPAALLGMIASLEQTLINVY